MEVTNKRLHGAIDTFNSQMMLPLTPAVCEETKPSGGAGMHGHHAVVHGQRRLRSKAEYCTHIVVWQIIRIIRQRMNEMIRQLVWQPLVEELLFLFSVRPSNLSVAFIRDDPNIIRTSPEHHPNIIRTRAGSGFV